MKKKFVNRAEYAIGIPEVDVQHEYFFLTINRLKKLFSGQYDEKVMTNLIEELVLYSKFHFKSEENIMILTDYPELERHRTIHYKLLEDLGEAKMSFEIIEEDSLKLTNFLEKWLLSHIMVEDREFGKFYKKKKQL